METQTQRLEVGLWDVENCYWRLRELLSEQSLQERILNMDPLGLRMLNLLLLDEGLGLRG